MLSRENNKKGHLGSINHSFILFSLLSLYSCCTLFYLYLVSPYGLLYWVCRGGGGDFIPWSAVLIKDTVVAVVLVMVLEPWKSWETF